LLRISDLFKIVEEFSFKDVVGIGIVIFGSFVADEADEKSFGSSSGKLLINSSKIGLI